MTEKLQLSQASLQDYLECKRRFYLKHVLKLDWPAHQTNRSDQQQLRAQKGVAFHRLMHQQVLNLPEDRLAATAESAGLGDWWTNYQQHPIQSLGGQQHAEVTLTAPLEGHRLLAKYDLVSLGPPLSIVDWKTSKRRDETWLRARMQTVVYRYLMVVAGGDLHGGVQPEEIEMIYWFADDPAAPIHLRYGQRQFADDERELRKTIAEIASLAKEQADLTDDTALCRFCVFRSLCDRGSLPGPIDEFETDWDEGAAAFDFEQIQEIAF